MKTQVNGKATRKVGRPPRAAAPRGRPPLVVTALLGELERVSPAQRNVLSLLIQGQRADAIADALDISRSTVQNHTGAIYSKFEVTGQPELLALFLHKIVKRTMKPNGKKA
jgi:DNA-binding CsgD family transcriptional regulator